MIVLFLNTFNSFKICVSVAKSNELVASSKNNISGFYKDAEKLGKDLAIKIINQMK